MTVRDRTKVTNQQLEAWQMLYGDRFYCPGFPGAVATLWLVFGCIPHRSP